MDIWLILVSIILLFIIVLAPVLYSLYITYKLKAKIIRRAFRSKDEKVDIEYLKSVVNEMGKPVSVVPGLTRGLMALTIILVLGVSILFVLAYGIPAGDSQTINTILSMLAGTLAAITGFYFGGKTVVESKAGSPVNEKKDNIDSKDKQKTVDATAAVRKDE